MFETQPDLRECVSVIASGLQRCVPNERREWLVQGSLLFADGLSHGWRLGVYLAAGVDRTEAILEASSALSRSMQCGVALDAELQAFALVTWVSAPVTLHSLGDAVRELIEGRRFIDLGLAKVHMRERHRRGSATHLRA